MASGTTLRANFDPPPSGGKGRAFALALLAHILLVLALSWGLHWKNDAQDQAVDAELWSATAQIAAPRAARESAPPPHPPEPTPPQPRPVTQPKPVIAPPAPQADNSARDAELALEQRKQREEAQRRADAEKARAQQIAQQQAAQRQKERERQEAAAKAAAAAAKAKADQDAALAKAKAADAAKRKAAEQQAAEKAAQQQKVAQKAAAQQKARADAAANANRQAYLRHLNALASGDETGTSSAANGSGKTPGGTASRDAGPSAGYGAKVRAKVFPNITYPDMDSLSGNPDAEVEVRTTPDGTIIGKTLLKPSGVPSWDAAVLRAIDKTETLPRDVDGRVPSGPIIIEFRPH